MILDFFFFSPLEVLGIVLQLQTVMGGGVGVEWMTATNSKKNSETHDKKTECNLFVISCLKYPSFTVKCWITWNCMF